jgi:hypothetical protein
MWRWLGLRCLDLGMWRWLGLRCLDLGMWRWLGLRCLDLGMWRWLGLLELLSRYLQGQFDLYWMVLSHPKLSNYYYCFERRQLILYLLCLLVLNCHRCGFRIYRLIPDYLHYLMD